MTRPMAELREQADSRGWVNEHLLSLPSKSYISGSRAKTSGSRARRQPKMDRQSRRQPNMGEVRDDQFKLMPTWKSPYRSHLDRGKMKFLSSCAYPGCSRFTLD